MSEDKKQKTHDTLKNFIPPTREEIEKEKDRLKKEVVLSLCVVCKGEVKANYKFYEKTGEPVALGNSISNSVRRIEGWYCSRCGLAYHFPPPKLFGGLCWIVKTCQSNF